VRKEYKDKGRDWGRQMEEVKRKTRDGRRNRRRRQGEVGMEEENAGEREKEEEEIS